MIPVWWMWRKLPHRNEHQTWFANKYGTKFYESTQSEFLVTESHVENERFFYRERKVVVCLLLRKSLAKVDWILFELLPMIWSNCSMHLNCRLPSGNFQELLQNFSHPQMLNVISHPLSCNRPSRREAWVGTVRTVCSSVWLRLICSSQLSSKSFQTISQGLWLHGSLVEC